MIKPDSSAYFAVCGFAGVLSCGLTHFAVTPIDMVKCNKQNNPAKFNKGMIGNMGILTGYKGPAGLFRGWSPTLIGYSLQGLGKFGLNDFFKAKYKHDVLGEDFCKKYPRVYYAMCSGSAEFFADILLCPWETVKLKVQTVDINNWLEGKSNGYARGLRDGLPKVIAEEGYGGLFKIIKPLWGRQIPYTIIKFVAFEDFIRRIYGYTESSWGMKQDDFNEVQQLGWTFAAGYGAGIFCGAVSHPADTMASLIAKNPGTSAMQLYTENGGFGGLWGGFGARVIMIGTLTGLQWFIYNTTKVAFGLEASGKK